MHGVAMRHAIEHSLVIKANTLDDQRIALPFAHGISKVGGIRVLGKRSPIHPDFAEGVRVFEKHEDALRCLNDLKRLLLGYEIGEADLAAADIFVLAKRSTAAGMASRQILTKR